MHGHKSNFADAKFAREASRHDLLIARLAVRRDGEQRSGSHPVQKNTTQVVFF
jgi:hypothetical protein